MARKKIREFDSKRFLKEHLKRLANIDLQIPSAKALAATAGRSAETNSTENYFFAAECLSLLSEAVGNDAAHFDISLARKRASGRQRSGDWLVLQLQELISLAYQISTIQFENMRPIGVGLLSTILEKFTSVADPELLEHLLLEQYQAQLVSAVRTALDTYSCPVLLEAGLQLATKGQRR